MSITDPLSTIRAVNRFSKPKLEQVTSPISPARLELTTRQRSTCATTLLSRIPISPRVLLRGATTLIGLAPRASYVFTTVGSRVISLAKRI